MRDWRIYRPDGVVRIIVFQGMTAVFRLQPAGESRSARWDIGISREVLQETRAMSRAHQGAAAERSWSFSWQPPQLQFLPPSHRLVLLAPCFVKLHQPLRALASWGLSWGGIVPHVVSCPRSPKPAAARPRRISSDPECFTEQRLRFEGRPVVGLDLLANGQGLAQLQLGLGGFILVEAASFRGRPARKRGRAKWDCGQTDGPASVGSWQAGTRWQVDCDRRPFRGGSVPAWPPAEPRRARTA